MPSFKSLARLKASRAIPPWEIASRRAHLERRSRIAALATNKDLNPNKALISCLKKFKLAAKPLEIGRDGQWNLAKIDVDLAIQNELATATDSISLTFQRLSLTVSTKRIRRACIKIVHSIAPIVSRLPSEVIFKFLVALATITNTREFLPSENPPDGNIKLSCWRTSLDLFEILAERHFAINETNAFHILNSYTRLCAGYAQEVNEFGSLYHRVIDSILNGLFLSPVTLDNILSLHDRLGLYDVKFAKYLGDRASESFSLFDENQIGNFCRYMVRIVNLRRCLPNVEVGSEWVSYTIGDAEVETLLQWDFKESKFIKCLEKKLPLVLHEYTYFNLVDIAQMYSVYNIKASAVLPRFSTELWRHLYVLKYGYPLKALVVLSSLGLGDASTFGRLVRNIPSMLAFRWPLPLVTETMSACGKVGIRGQKIYNRLGEYLQTRLSTLLKQVHIARLFKGLQEAGIQNQGLYNKVFQMARANSNWLSSSTLLVMAEYASTVGLSLRGILDSLNPTQVANFSLAQVTSLLTVLGSYQSETCDSSRIIANPLENTATHGKAWELVTCALENLSSRRVDNETAIELDHVAQVIRGLLKLGVHLPKLHEICLDALQRSQIDDVILQVVSDWATFGKMEHVQLRQALLTATCKLLDHWDGDACAMLLWNFWSLGVDVNDAQYLLILKRLLQLEPKSHVNHHIQILAYILKTFYDGEALDETWRVLVKSLDGTMCIDSWKPEAEYATQVSRAARDITNCKTFVQAGPFMVPLETSFGSLYKSGLAYSGTGDVVTWGPQDSVAIYLYNRNRMPLYCHYESKSNVCSRFDHYFQTRRKILRNFGYVDTLICTL